jgi:phosphoglycolate phosphatase
MMKITCKDRQFPNIKAIIFDKDGTLENSEPFLRELTLKRTRLLDAKIPGIAEPLLMAFGLYNDQLDPTGLMAVGSRQENEIAAAAYVAETGKGWFEALEIVRQAFEEADRYIVPNETNSPIFPEVKSVIKQFYDQGLILGVLSSDSTENVERFLENNGLSAYCKLKLGKHPQYAKPDPALFIYACQQLEVNPQETLMVGDALGDILIAKRGQAAGAIGICRQEKSRNHLRESDVMIECLTDIKGDL